MSRIDLIILAETCSHNLYQLINTNYVVLNSIISDKIGFYIYSFVSKKHGGMNHMNINIFQTTGVRDILHNIVTRLRTGTADKIPGYITKYRY